MRFWSVLIPAERYATERLYARDTIDLPAFAGDERLAEGDQVALVADVAPAAIFALGTVMEKRRPVRLTYTHKLFDEPRPAASRAPGDHAARELTSADFEALTPAPAPATRTWLVSVDMPIEAATAADAARQFWSYVHDLGPAELPALVSPSDDELAVRVFVRGEEANQDPEED